MDVLAGVHLEMVFKEGASHLRQWQFGGEPRQRRCDHQQDLQPAHE